MNAAAGEPHMMKRRSPRLVLSTGLLLAGWILSSVPSRTQGLADSRPPELVDGHPVVAGEVLIRFASDTPAEAASVSLLVEADKNERIGGGGWRLVRSPTHNVALMLAKLRSKAGVVAAEPNYVFETIATPNDPSFPQLWGLNNPWVSGADIHAVNAWNISTGSSATVVGVVDTGIDYTHPDLAANIWSAPTAFTISVGGRSLTCPAGSHGFNAIAFAGTSGNVNGGPSCNPMDDQYHGTHVSGTIGAAGNNSVGVVGVNWTTSVMGLKFLDSGGSGSSSNAINAIEFAVQAKAVFASTGGANVRVLSNSWGGGGFSNSLLTEVQRANTANMLFVAAAGNAGSNNDTSPFYPASYGDPIHGAAPNVIAVAATDANDSLAGFSNFGATSVHLGAPGVSILSTTPGGNYGYVNGTSMATPHVAGAGALVLSACTLTTAQLKAALLNNVDGVPSLNGLLTTSGRLNAYKALLSCATITPPTVAVTSPTAGATLTAGLIPVTATASSGVGISKVEFFANGAPIGTDTSSPYSISWSPVAGGYTLTAIATDNLGGTTTSATVGVTVTAGGTGRVNVAAAANGGAAIASSTHSAGYASAGAINGDRTGQNWGAGGGWNDATPAAFPDWLQIDFNGSKTIDEIDVFSVQDNYQAPSVPTLTMAFTRYGLTDFLVQYFDGAQWLTVPGGAISGNTLVWRQVTFAPLTTTKIRIWVNGALDTWSRIAEVEAYTTTGASAPTLTLVTPTSGQQGTGSLNVTLTGQSTHWVNGTTQASFGAAGVTVNSTTVTDATHLTANMTIASSATLGARMVTATTGAEVVTLASGFTVTAAGGAGINVASAANGGIATASSTHSSGYLASGAINGERSGQSWGSGSGWNDATPNTWPDWLEVAFSGTQTISEVDVFSVQDNYLAPSVPTPTMTFTKYGLRDFLVQYFDGTQWLTVPGGTVTGNTLVWRRLTFASLTTTKIRIWVTGALDTWSRIAEVEAYTTASLATSTQARGFTYPVVVTR